MVPKYPNADMIIRPIVGGFLGETEGWRWVEGLMAIFTGALWILGALTIPETYSPVLLRRHAKKLSSRTGKVYKSRIEAEHGAKSVSQEFKTALSRPWILLLMEPIVLLLSIYMAIIYGTLYMMFAAFPIVYQQQRGWSPGIGGLAFIGVAMGMMIAVAYSLWDNKRYKKIEDQHGGQAPPEAQLPPCIIGSIFLPVGLFIFSWTNYPSIHWSVSIIGTAPFGFWSGVGVGVLEHHELPHRRVCYICCERLGGEQCAEELVWCFVPVVYYLQVHI